MSLRLRTGSALSLTLAVLLALASVVLGAGRASALPTNLPLHAQFSNLMPGDSASKEWDVSIPRDARVTSADVRDGGAGVAQWEATLCPDTGAECIDLVDIRSGDLIDSGDYALRVSVTISTLDPGQSQSIEGRIALVERAQGELALTGSDGVVVLAVSALAAAAVGAFLLLAARRRRREEEAR